jgi:ceramide glucosyltransferase
MALIFYILAAVLIYFSFRSFVGGISYLRYFDRSIAAFPNVRDYTPLVSVLAPCRGLDEGMLENFDAILHQNYPDYQVIFIIDDPSDEAAKLIESSWRESDKAVKLVVAPTATDSGQKVENLREGVLHADPRSEVFVFVDSDARASPDLLRNLVSPLTDEGVAVSTGYRWFVTQGISPAAELRSAWNASVATAMGDAEDAKFCWGGAMAMTRAAFERLNVRERWRGTLSDDFALARFAREAGLAIRFVPQAMTPSYGNCTFRELLEFTNRQMKLTRVYAPDLWIASFLGSGLFIAVMTGAAVLLIAGQDDDPLAFYAALVTLTLVSVFSIGKSILRVAAIRTVISDVSLRDHVAHCVLWALTPVLFFANCLAALVSRRIRWRGTEYTMISAEETRVEKRRTDGSNL